MTNFFRKCSFTAQDMASSRLTSGVTRVVSGKSPGKNCSAQKSRCLRCISNRTNLLFVSGSVPLFVDYCGAIPELRSIVVATPGTAGGSLLSHIHCYFSRALPVGTASSRLLHDRPDGINNQPGIVFMHVMPTSLANRVCGFFA